MDCNGRRIKNIIYKNTVYTSIKTHPFRITTKRQLVVFSEIMSVSFEKVRNTTCGQKAVCFKGVFRLESPYIREIRSSELLCEEGGKVVVEVSGLNTDPFFKERRTAWPLRSGRYTVTKIR